ncbi:MAG TPA: universal stress protein [Capsulimonadaceae bacterium]|jgi:nucleotide-binding universal stress UspA family protein
MLSRLFGSKSTPAPEDDTPVQELVAPWRRIVIPASSAPFSLRSIDSAAKLAAKSPGCDVRLLYVLEVPRAYALHAPMPGEDSQAQTVLADGLEEARRWGLDAVTDVLRVRDAIEGLLKYIEQQNVDLLVLGARPDEVRGISKEMVGELFRRASCEVVVDYIAEEQ